MKPRRSADSGAQENSCDLVFGGLVCIWTEKVKPFSRLGKDDRLTLVSLSMRTVGVWAWDFGVELVPGGADEDWSQVQFVVQTWHLNR